MSLADLFHPHDPILVTLSIALAILSSYVSLELGGRIKAAAGSKQMGWLFAAGIAMGGGIWSMHFVAMIALELPFAVAYNLSLTVLSLLIAILVATAGFYTVFWRPGSSLRFILGGAVMGVGVAAMHYTGMAALIMPATRQYDFRLVALSGVIAIAASIVALWLAFHVRRLSLKLLSAMLMGFAVSGMHFTGMAAFVCGNAQGGNPVVPGVSSIVLAVCVAGISGAILLTGLALALHDQRQRRLHKHRIDALLRHSADLTAIVDQNWGVTYLSPGASRFVGHVGEIAIGANFLAFFTAEAKTRALDLMQRARAQPEQPVHEEFAGTGTGAEWFEITLNDQFADTAIQGVIVNLHDITKQKQAIEVIKDSLDRAHEAAQLAKKQSLALEQAHEAAQAAEEQARLLARHDALTGLPNRRVFTTTLETSFSHAQSGLANLSLLLIDLDDFKKINDLQGHQIGDAVLCEIARCLGASLRKSDMVARLGGDEFAVISVDEKVLEAHMEDTAHLATRLLGILQRPLLLDEGRFEINASIGIATYEPGITDVTSLMRAADIAMYQAKRTGKGAFRFFDREMDAETRERAALEKALMQAVEREEIQPHYQPIIDIGTQRIRSFEALARWTHPERGFVPPDVFIPILEQLGLMPKLTTSILRQACRHALKWPEDIRVSVNLSPSELKDPAVVDRILAVLAEENFPPTRLELEITEVVLVSDTDAAKAILTALKEYGVTISLDDFGTGYSSLYHLRELQFDRIKIDRSFVQNMRENADNEKIIDALLGLTRNLNLQVVAEGIENSATLELLTQKGCKYGQGYHFGKAMTADSALALLEKDFCPADEAI
jgi:diguanylate cyclase (GGDEF)-like protein/PAS domain S-box-containing protein